MSHMKEALETIAASLKRSTLYGPVDTPVEILELQYDDSGSFLLATLAIGPNGRGTVPFRLRIEI